jgi:hypothetical protein
MGSVPRSEAGVASGTNSMLRELGGVLGIAVLASVFARPCIYHSPQAFIDGFTQALWVGVGFSARHRQPRSRRSRSAASEHNPAPRKNAVISPRAGEAVGGALRA